MSNIFEGFQSGYSAAGAYADEKRRRDNNQTVTTPLGARHPCSDPLADGMLAHYLAQSRAADQVRRVIAASTLPMDEDDGA